MKPLQISIIAFKYHFDILNNLLYLLNHSSTHIHLITSENIINLLPHIKADHRINISLCNTPDYRKHILRQRDTLSKSHHILVLTVYKYFKFFHDLSQQLPVSIIIHNTHFAFQDKRFQNKSLKIKDKLVLAFKNILLRENLYKNKLLETVHALYFLSEATLNYARANYSAYEPKMSILPYRYIFPKDKKYNSIFCLVIPGGINAETRDYHFLKLWIKTYFSERKIQIVFLGNSSSGLSQLTLKELKSEISDRVDIIAFDHYLDEHEYDRWINKAHLLLASIKKEVEYLGYVELYGYSKVSGSISDAIKADKPLMIPDFYPTDEMTDHIILPFDDQTSFDKIMNRHYNNVGENLNTTRPEINIQYLVNKLLTALDPRKKKVK